MTDTEIIEAIRSGRTLTLVSQEIGWTLIITPTATAGRWRWHEVNARGREMDDYEFGEDELDRLVTTVCIRLQGQWRLTEVGQ